MALEGVEITLRDRPEFRARGYSVVEDSTPVDISDSSGGIGQMTVELDENEFEGDLDLYDLLTLHNEPIELRDGANGITSGIVRGIGSPDYSGTLTADGAAAALAVNRQALPFNGTLENAFDYYLDLAGYTAGRIVDPSIASRSVSYMGFNAVVWDELKKICSAEQVEMTYVSGNMVFRPLRERVSENYRNSSVTPQLATADLARNVDIAYFNRKFITGGLVYPTGGWTPDVKIITVNAGETRIETLEANVSLQSVTQPTCVASVSRFHSTSSVYCVTGSDGLVIPPAQWAADGGSLTVAIGSDARSIDVTIQAPATGQFEQYTIAMPAGTSADDQYSSLRLVGTGVHFRREVLRLSTSVDPDVVTAEVGTTVENEYVNTVDDAHRLGRWVMKRYGSPRYTLQVTTSGINRLGDNGVYVYPSVADFNTIYSGDLISNFNAAWPGGTIADFNAFMAAQTAIDFENQAFGNIGGSRIRFGDAWFRIRTGTTTPDTITYTAEEDTTVGDFNDEWADGVGWTPGPAVEATNLVTNPEGAGSGSIEVFRQRVGNPKTVSGAGGYTLFGATGSYAGGRYRMTATAAVNCDVWPQAPATEATGGRFTAVIGERFAWRAEVYNPNAFDLYVRTQSRWYNAAGTSVGGFISGAWLLVAPGTSIVVEATGVVPNIATLTGMLPTLVFASSAAGAAVTVSTLMDFTDWALYLGAIPQVTPVPFAYGTVSYDPDLTAAWQGTVNGSATILSGMPITGSSSGINRTIRSSQWALQGSYSTRVVALGNAPGVVYADLSTITGANARGKTFTIITTSRALGPASGSNPRRPALRLFGYVTPYIYGPTSANVAGVEEIRWTVTIPNDVAITFVTLRLFTTETTAQNIDQPDVWWDVPTIVEVASPATPYTGPPFSGATPNDAGPGYAYAWTGPVDASTSTRSPLVLGPFTPTVADLNAAWAGKKWKDIVVAPLRGAPK